MKRLLAIFMIIVLLLSFSGCKEDKKEQNLNNTVVNIPEPEENPEKGGIISIYSYKPDTLCPLLSINNANIRMLSIVFDGLFTIDENLNVIPCLAESYTASSNNMKYTVDLKQDVKFHDGSSLTAQDVIFSVETAKAAPESLYYHNVSVIDSVKAINSNKVEFTLIKPLSKFANLLDFPIIKKQSEPVDKETFLPIGTGGFVFENRNEGNLLHLVRNENWWGGEVYPDSVKVRLLPDKDTALYAFSSGTISLCPAENDEWGKFVDTQKTEYKEYMTEYYNFIGLNNESGFFADESIRKALSYIIDREEVLKSGAPGFSESSNAPVRKNWITAQEKSETEHNINKARKILEEAGWKLSGGVYKRSSGHDSLTLKLNILVNEESYKKEQFAKKAAEELSNFGIPATVKKVPYEQYVEAINSKSYEMFIGSMNLSKELDFEFMFAEGNMFGISDEELLASVKNMQLAPDEEDYGLKTAEFIKLFNEKVPFIGIGFENSVILYKSDIMGAITPVSNNIYNGIEKMYIKKES